MRGIHYANAPEECQETSSCLLPLSHDSNAETEKIPINGSNLIVTTPPSPITEEITIAITEPAVAQQIVVEVAIPVPADSVAQHDVADPIPTRSATIPAPISCVVAVYKLAALIVRAAEDPATPMAPPAALPKRCGRDDHRTQEGDHDDGKKVVPVPRMLHKLLPQF